MSTKRRRQATISQGLLVRRRPREGDGYVSLVEEQLERQMVKVVWFLKKADHLSMEEFRRWWLDGHAPVIKAKQGSMLKRYIVNIRTERDDLPAAAGTPCEWDGMAEEWFENDEAARRALSLPSAPETRADVMAHVSSMARMIVTEHPIIDGAQGG